MSQTHANGRKTVEACPECGSATFRVRNTGQIVNDNTDPYRCSDCHTTFDTPDIRPQKQEPPTPGGLVGHLIALNSDDV